MRGHNLCFLWKIIPKLSLLPLLIWSTGKNCFITGIEFPHPGAASTTFRRKCCLSKAVSCPHPNTNLTKPDKVWSKSIILQNKSHNADKIKDVLIILKNSIFDEML